VFGGRREVTTGKETKMNEEQKLRGLMWQLHDKSLFRWNKNTPFLELRIKLPHFGTKDI